MRVLLELARIILIFLFLGSILAYVLGTLYSEFDINMEQYGWTASLGIYLFLFVLYRNRWQFSGWYKGKGKEKLPKKLSRMLNICSVVLILSPPILNSILK
ncbi:hypothetical protein SM124_14680 [Bacillus sp. 31A1R]|uniref:Uncharacterized protein n=1 Tax=Robertmurraya mangrovi TaxID=3098077 RepID=A0ABU5J0P9_9BACI|nr:hypothetical protein [Bacillus sp. 31A1R]MDZ5472961.1 hypothetical protein [Bacillus sp. 31A1R]